MIYNKFVEIGRVVFIAKGKDEGKLAVIVNVVDGNRVCFLIKQLNSFLIKQTNFNGRSFSISIKE